MKVLNFMLLWAKHTGAVVSDHGVSLTIDSAEF